MPASLQDFEIKSLPASAYYIADFISEDEEAVILNKIAATPKPKWKYLLKRRLQTWPSDLTAKNALLESQLPPWLTDPIVARILSYPKSTAREDNIFTNSPHQAPNHVLVNEYVPGQGISPHKDGSAYHPVVCTVSLGASLCLDLYGTKEDGTIEDQPRWKILQEPRSLLITTDSLYTDYLHGIAEVTEEQNIGPQIVANWDLLRSREQFGAGRFDRSTRTSLTYRDVLKVSKLGNKFGNLGKR
ncbi:Alpha-ketoglutarate-dependent dioxygenase alkB-like protein 6 [Phlyctema vagabunda]|uniref:Alpha-ketoglutarate-dependent dioxygenase alkB-like protein 6 n=1 Tax=Phlyctema vagabunda TaxID=108571 RepID=A0ABR4PSW6_9HELO